MPFTHRPAMDERQLAQIMTKARVLVETGFFDEVYYTENNAMPPGMELFEHFFLTGYKEGRSPPISKSRLPASIRCSNTR